MDTHRPNALRLIALACLAAAAALTHPALAQGQDSTAGERNLRIMAELLPGTYDNVNQNYFDGRRKLAADDRHPRVSTTITRVEAPAFGRHVFLWVNRTQGAQGPTASWRLATLEPGPASDEVTMRHHLRMQGEITAAELATLRPQDLRRTEGCDYVFKRRADQFRGVQGPKACRFEWDGQQVYTDNVIEVSRSALFFHDHKFVIKTGKRITGVASGEPFWLERAR
ncbi:MAG: CpcT/CpeT family chromophore lyase, partial [Planctomycetota bacterium]